MEVVRCREEAANCIQLRKGPHIRAGPLLSRNFSMWMLHFLVFLGFVGHTSSFQGAFSSWYSHRCQPRVGQSNGQGFLNYCSQTSSARQLALRRCYLSDFKKALLMSTHTSAHQKEAKSVPQIDVVERLQEKLGVKFRDR